MATQIQTTAGEVRRACDRCDQRRVEAMKIAEERYASSVRFWRSLPWWKRLIVGSVEQPDEADVWWYPKVVVRHLRAALDGLDDSTIVLLDDDYARTIRLGGDSE